MPVDYGGLVERAQKRGILHIQFSQTGNGKMPPVHLRSLLSKWQVARHWTDAEGLIVITVSFTSVAIGA